MCQLRAERPDFYRSEIISYKRRMTTIFSFPGTIQKTLANLTIDGSLISSVSTSRFIPDIFRYFPPEITGQTNPFSGEVLPTCENISYVEALYCDNPYPPFIIYPYRQTLVDRIISLIPLSEVDDIIYLNQFGLLEKLVQFIRVGEQDNEVFTGGNNVSCDLFYITWDATYDWNTVLNEPILASSLVLNFYDLVGFYQTSFVNYTAENMETDYQLYKNTTNNLLNNPMGYLLQRTIFIYNQILTFCQQGLAGKSAFLPPQYISYWSVPARQRLFVEKYSPDYYYGNVFIQSLPLDQSV